MFWSKLQSTNTGIFRAFSEKPETCCQWKGSLRMLNAQIQRTSTRRTPFRTLTFCQSQKPPQLSASPKVHFFLYCHAKKKPTAQHISPLFVTLGPERCVFLLLSNLPMVKLNQHHWKPNEDSNYMHAPAGTLLLYRQCQHGCAQYWLISFCLFSWEREKKNPRGAQILQPQTD